MLPPWEFEDPSCKDIDTDIFYPEATTNPVNLPMIKTMCNSCLHKADCLEWALHYEGFGIWAGTVEADRKRIRAKRNIVLKEDHVA